RRGSRSQSQVVAWYLRFASRSVPFHGNARRRGVPAGDGGCRLLHPLFRRQLGSSAAGNVFIRRPAAAVRDTFLRNSACPPQSFCQQEFFQLPLRLPGRVATVYAHLVGGRTGGSV